MALRLKWIPRWIRWKDPFRKGQQEAADQYLGKKAKVQTLEDLNMARDFQELQEADRRKVELLFEKHGMSLASKGKGDRDTWACDDMTINASRSGLLELLVGLALGAAGLWFIGEKLKPDAPVSPPTQTEISVPDTEYEVRFYDKDGNQITVPRVPAGVIQ